MNEYAELLAQGWDPAVVTRPVDPELEKMRMAHEKEMEDKEMEMKKMELELEKQRDEAREKELEAEKERKELREKELEAEKERREKEAEKKTEEAEEKQKERDLRQKEQDNEKDKMAQKDEMKLIKRYGDALTQVISMQPDEVTDLPAYFRGVEEQFNKKLIRR